MRRVQLYIDEAMDDHLMKVARQRGISKSAVIRDAAWKYLGPAPESEPAVIQDPLEALIGVLDGEPIEDLDEFIYGPRE